MVHSEAVTYGLHHPLAIGWLCILILGCCCCVLPPALQGLLNLLPSRYLQVPRRKDGSPLALCAGRIHWGVAAVMRGFAHIGRLFTPDHCADMCADASPCQQCSVDSLACCGRVCPGSTWTGLYVGVARVSTCDCPSLSAIMAWLTPCCVGDFNSRAIIRRRGPAYAAPSAATASSYVFGSMPTPTRAGSCAQRQGESPPWAELEEEDEEAALERDGSAEVAKKLNAVHANMESLDAYLKELHPELADEFIPLAEPHVALGHLEFMPVVPGQVALADVKAEPVEDEHVADEDVEEELEQIKHEPPIPPHESSASQVLPPLPPMRHMQLKSPPPKPSPRKPSPRKPSPRKPPTPRKPATPLPVMPVGPAGLKASEAAQALAASRAKADAALALATSTSSGGFSPAAASRAVAAADIAFPTAAPASTANALGASRPPLGAAAEASRGLRLVGSCRGLLGLGGTSNRLGAGRDTSVDAAAPAAAASRYALPAAASFATRSVRQLPDMPSSSPPPNRGPSDSSSSAAAPEALRPRGAGSLLGLDEGRLRRARISSDLKGIRRSPSPSPVPRHSKTPSPPSA